MTSKEYQQEIEHLKHEYWINGYLRACAQVSDIETRISIKENMKDEWNDLQVSLLEMKVMK